MNHRTYDDSTAAQPCLIGTMPPGPSSDGSSDWLDDDTLRISFPQREKLRPVVVKFHAGHSFIYLEGFDQEALLTLRSLYTEPDILRDFVRVHLASYRAGRTQGMEDQTSIVLQALRAAHVDDLESLESRIAELARDLDSLKAARSA